MIIASLYFAAATAKDCRVVVDDVIRMRDLAAAAPAFSQVAADSAVAYSPLPGSVRILQGAELARLARRNGIADGEFRDVCFQRAMRQLDEQQLLDALRSALAIPSAEVALMDFSRFPAPVGDLVFPRSGIALTRSAEAALWKGYIIYGGGQHFPIWARVKLRVRLNRVIATDNLVTRQPVRADQLRIEPLDGVPDALAPAQSLDQVVGKTLLRPVRRGATLSLDDVSSAIVVRRGDKVEVDFRSPVVHLRFDATAEMDGRFGDRIRLRNLQSTNVFVAEVSGKDQARVVLDDETIRSSADLRAPVDPCDGSGEKDEGCH
jgi:flagella basal body P-ring formation protein FlgA